MARTNWNILTLWVLIFLACFSLLSCASVSVDTNFDQSANFHSFHTYDWMLPTQQDNKNRNVDAQAIAQIKSAIDRQLELKGYQRVNENPDFLLASHTSFVDRVFTLQPYSSGSVSRPSRYKEGTVVIEIFDPETSKRIWWGKARLVAGTEDDLETKTKQANEVVQKLLKEFPPKGST